MMDDIFSTPKEEQEPKSDANFDWKKTGIDKHERITLKVDVREANAYNASKKNDSKKKLKAPSPTEVPNGFKKISKKIRDSFDDEDEDDDYILVPVFLDRGESSILKALTDDERKMVDQRLNNPNVDNLTHQTATREAAIQQAERILDKAGIARELDQRIIQEKRTQSVDVKDIIEASPKRNQPQRQKIEKIIDKPMKSSFEKEIVKIKNIDEKELSKTIKQIDEKQKQEAALERKSAQETLQKEQNQREQVIKEETKLQRETEQLNKQKSNDVLEKAEPKEIADASKQAQKEGFTREEKNERTKELILEKSGRQTENRENITRENKSFDKELQRQIEEQKRAKSSEGR